MLFYLILILILAFFCLGRVKELDENKVFFLFLVFLWFLATFRSLDIGNDTFNYYTIFKTMCNNGDYSMWIGRYEIGYLLLNKFLSYITSNFTIFLAIINTFIYSAYYNFIKKYSRNKMFSLFIFVTLGFWGTTVNTIRLQIAVALYMYAWIQKDEGRKILPIILVIIAFYFQRISIAFLLVLIVPKTIKKKFYVFVSLIGFLIFAFFEKIMGIISWFIPYFSTYLFNETYHIGDASVATIIGIIIRLCILIFSFLVYKKNRKNMSKDIIGQINMIFISFVLMLSSLKFNLIDRCATFYWVFVLLLIPNLMCYIKDKKNNILLKIIVIIVCIIYFVIVNIFRPEWNHIYPYKMIF